MKNKKIYVLEFRRPNTKLWHLKASYFTRREAIQERNRLNELPKSFYHPQHRVVAYVPEDSK